MVTPVALFWMRRDLRLHDNAALYHALRSGYAVQPIFIFDRNILDELTDRSDRRVEFIHRHLEKIQEQLEGMGASLDVRYGKPGDIFPELLKEYEVKAVYTNRDYEPYARERDQAMQNYFTEKGVSYLDFKDQVIFEKNEVLKDDGKPYTVFTPYSRRWKAKLNDFYLKSFPTEKYFTHFFQQRPRKLPALTQMNFKPQEKPFPEVGCCIYTATGCPLPVSNIA